MNNELISVQEIFLILAGINPNDVILFPNNLVIFHKFNESWRIVELKEDLQDNNEEVDDVEDLKNLWNFQENIEYIGVKQHNPKR